MNLIQRSSLVVLMTVFVGVGTCVAQGRLQLAQGRRAIQDKVTFVFELAPDSRYNNKPDGVTIFTRFTERPATGRVYVDGKAIGRFDESMSFNSNIIDAPYGRHTITVAFASPALMMDFYVNLRGPGVMREILDEQESLAPLPPDLSKRVTDLERKVRDLETEIASLKKKRNH